MKEDAGTETACWLERRTRDWMFASSSTGRNDGRILFSRVNLTLSADSYPMSVTPLCYSSGT